MNIITAKSKKNQKLVNKAVNYLVKYNAANNERTLFEDTTEDYYNTPAHRKLDNRCKDLFNKFLDVMDELPAYQAKVIFNHSIYTEQ